MKLIEYKPDIQIIIDVSNIPNNMSVEECLQMLKSQPLTFKKKFNTIEIENSKPWVHPDYVVKEIDFNSEIKEKTFSELIEIIKEAGPMPDSMKGNSFENLYWNAYDPLDDVTPEIWEIAKPKFNPELAKKYKAPIIFGTAGETESDFIKSLKLGLETLKKIPNRKKRLTPVVFENIWDKERADFYNRHQSYSDKTSDLYWLSKSSEQLSDWLKRKKKTPLLNPHDFIMIDNIVDKIFEKHTRNLRKEKHEYKYLAEETIRVADENFYKSYPF